MGHLNPTIDCPDLIDCLDLGTESAVNAEDFAVNDCSDRQVVKHFSAVFPGVGVSVLPVDFIVKSIDSSDLSGLKGSYLDSWLPLRSVILSGYFTLRQSRYSKV